MIRNNFFIVPDAFITRLHLKGAALLVASLVYSYSKDGQGCFYGSTEYLAERVNVSHTLVKSILKKLTDEGILCRRMRMDNNLSRRYEYWFNRELEEEMFGDGDMTDANSNSQYTDEGEQKNFTVGEQKNFTVGEQKNFTDNNKESSIRNTQKKKKDKKTARDFLTYDNPTYEELGLTPQNLYISESVYKRVNRKVKCLQFYDTTDKELLRKFYIIMTQPSWLGKSITATQASISKCAEYPNDFILELLDKSISNDWQNVVYDNTPKIYQEYLKMKNSRGIPIGGGTTYVPLSEQERADYEEFSKMFD